MELLTLISGFLFFLLCNKVYEVHLIILKGVSLQ